jgi:DNA-binding transcriptional ArsR family regulator
LTVPHALHLFNSLVNFLHMPQLHTPCHRHLFRVLADPTRRGIVEHLCNGPIRAGQLADELGMSPPAMSHHLKLLMDTGIVTDHRGDTDARA